MSYYVYDDKKIYYYETGSGHPLLLLHGNTASSKMFAQIAEEYSKSFKVILIDFLGHGLSDRLEKFPSNLWFYEAQQVIAFLRFKQYTDVYIIGSSGGAIVALNVALEAPDLVKKVIADSFEGERADETFTKNLLKDRKNAKNDPNAQGFYAYMHGQDWELIVDNDTDAIIRHQKEIGAFFHKPLEEQREIDQLVRWTAVPTQGNGISDLVVGMVVERKTIAFGIHQIIVTAYVCFPISLSF